AAACIAGLCEAAGLTLGACVLACEEGTEKAEQLQSEAVNLLDEMASRHTLYGDETGGHLCPGLAGKTPFPPSWSPIDILHQVSDVATDPESVFVTSRQGVIAYGERFGTIINVVMDR